MWGLKFLHALLSEENLEASVQLIVRAIDGKMAEEKKKTCFFFLLSQIHLSLIGTNLKRRTNC